MNPVHRAPAANREPADVCASEALPDVISTGLKAIFCGLNPGLGAAATGHHFEGRNNRFWRTLYHAGFTPTQFSPEDDRDLLACGYGLTTVVERATVRAAEVSTNEYLAAVSSFRRKIETYKPAYVAFLGKAAYKVISGQREIAWGNQGTIFGGAAVWVLPNPSGLNRSFSLDELVIAYSELRRAV